MSATYRLSGKDGWWKLVRRKGGLKVYDAIKYSDGTLTIESDGDSLIIEPDAVLGIIELLTQFLATCPTDGSP